MTRPAPSAFRRAVFAAVLLVAAGVLVEGGARLLGERAFPAGRAPGAVAAPQDPTMAEDEVTGWAPRVGPTQAFGVPGGTYVNRLQMRGPEVTSPKPTGERRVLLLGDSSVFGVLVPDGQTMGDRLQQSLQAVDPHVKVLNGGIPGWSSVQSRRALQTRWSGLEPDLVVIASLWSDAMGAEQTDAEKFGEGGVAFLHGSRAFLSLRAWVSTLRSGAAQETIRVDLRPYAAQAGVGPRGPAGGAGGPGGPQGPDPARAATVSAVLEPPPTVRMPLADYPGSLDALADAAEDLGAQVAFLVLPCIRDPSGEPIGDARDRYREAMRAAAAARGAPLADAPPAFRGGGAARLLLDDVHPSAEGHALVARTLAEALDPWVRR